MHARVVSKYAREPSAPFLAKVGNGCQCIASAQRVRRAVSRQISLPAITVDSVQFIRPHPFSEFTDRCLCLCRYSQAWRNSMNQRTCRKPRPARATRRGRQFATHAVIGSLKKNHPAEPSEPVNRKLTVNEI